VAGAEALGIGALLLSLAWPVSPELLGRTRAQTLAWYDRNGVRLAEQVSALETRREPVAIADVSPYAVLAVISTEDARFYDHHGVDLLATARAAWQNLAALRIVSGGSTLTQQLARLLLAEQAVRCGRQVPPRSWWQKAREAHLAVRLEQQLTKDAILAAFLNRAPFGNTAVGIEAAARRYFDTTAGGLSLAQAAYLAGLPKGPGTYMRHPRAARERQRFVLGLMRRRGVLTADEHARASAEPIRPGRYATRPRAIHAINAARARLAASGGYHGFVCPAYRVLEAG